MRNCLHKCNRTQVRPATNEETEGIKIVRSLLPNLTEAVREGRTRHFDITDEGILRTTNSWLWKAMSWTFAWEHQIRSRNRSSMHLQIPTPHHTVPDQKPTQSPRPRSRLQSVIAEFDFEKREIPRDIIGTYLRTESRWRNRVGKCRGELRQVNPLSFFILPKQARASSNR